MYNSSQAQRLHLTSYFLGIQLSLDFIVCNSFQLVHKLYTKWIVGITNSVLNQTSKDKLIWERERRKKERFLTKGKINYFFNSDTVCHPGYLGQNCSEICRYPTYGEECQKLCECKEEKYCDIATGCFSPDGIIFLNYE